MRREASVNDGDLTLMDMFGATEANFSTAVAGILLTGNALGQLRTAILTEVSYFPWASFVASIGTKALDLLETKRTDILIGALNKSREILEYRDREKHPPGEVATLPLIDRTLTSDHRPYLEIFFRGQSYQLPFDIHLELVMRGIILEIEDARITAIHSGSLDGSGTISVSGVQILSKPFPHIPFVGAIRFKEGIPI